MLPEDIGELEEERNTARGSSSLPVTIAFEDEDNMDLVCNFLYVLYKGGRCGDKGGEMRRENRNTCSFWKIPPLCKAAIHYDEKCQGSKCAELHCKQAVSLYEHWKTCDTASCLVCKSTVDLLMENFCGYLGKKGKDFERLVLQIKMAHVAAKKDLVERLIIGHKSC